MNQGNGRDSLSRRTSLFGVPGEGQLSKDPRPIKEKPYIVACVQRLEQYLVDASYEKVLTQQQLMCPPSKDFFCMLEFLLRQIDMNFAFKDPKKPEEETPALFKALKYPFGMSSRSLHSVGTPHAWPNFLAALHWLVELLTYHDAAEAYRAAQLEEDPCGSEGMGHAFFAFVSQAYSAFMSFDEREVALETEFVRVLLDRNKEKEETAARLKEHTLAVLAETERLRVQDTRVAPLTARLSGAESELAALKAEVAKAQALTEAKARELEEVKLFSGQQRKRVQELQEELTGLDATLRAQAARHLDADQLMSEKRELKQAIQAAMKRRDEVEHASNAIEMEISDKYREVERGVSALNALLDQSGLVQSLGGEIRVQPQSPNNILSMDIKTTVKPVLLAFLEEKRTLHQQNQPLLVEMHAKAEHKKEALALKRASLAELKAKLDRETSLYTGFKDSFVQPRKQLEQAILEIERDIGTIALQSKDSLSARQQDVQRLAQRLEDKRTAFEKIESDLNDQLDRYLDWILNHKETVNSKLGSLKAALERQTIMQ
jgi:kinetochore protein NDC80